MKSKADDAGNSRITYGASMKSKADEVQRGAIVTCLVVSGPVWRGKAKRLLLRTAKCGYATNGIVAFSKAVIAQFVTVRKVAFYQSQADRATNGYEQAC
jgi:hypothetical protein